MSASTLVFAWGNPGRGDDALGPLFADRLQSRFAERGQIGDLEVLTDFQLQIEHALDLAGRRRILFVDAAIDCSAPFAVTRVSAARDASFTTHAMTPQAVLQVYRDIHGEEPPAAWQLAIRGIDFALGNGLSATAALNLERAIDWTIVWLGNGGGERYNPPDTAEILGCRPCQ